MLKNKTSYTTDGHITLEKEGKTYTFDKYSALEIALALVDWAGEDYRVLDKIIDKVEEVENEI